MTNTLASLPTAEGLASSKLASLPARLAAQFFLLLDLCCSFRSRLVMRFLDAGAIDEKSARHTVTITGIPGWYMSDLQQRGLVLRAPNGRLFLDSDAAARFLKIRRREDFKATGFCTVVPLAAWAIYYTMFYS